jgi:predicted esterase
MSQPVIYVHGYGSSGNTDTAINLRRILGEGFEVISPTGRSRSRPPGLLKNSSWGSRRPSSLARRSVASLQTTSRC